MPETHLGPELMNEPPSANADRWNWWTDVISAALLGMAAVAAGWAAYQSSLWNSDAIFTLNAAIDAQRQAMVLEVKGMQRSTIDVNIFIAYVDAVKGHKDRLAAFIYSRIPPDFKPAFDAWLATRPFVNPNAPPTPFKMKEYRLISEEESERLMGVYFERLAHARSANRIADRYILLTIPFAMVSLLSGLSTRFRTRVTRSGVVALALAVFAFGLFELLSEAIIHA